MHVVYLDVGWLYVLRLDYYLIIIDMMQSVSAFFSAIKCILNALRLILLFYVLHNFKSYLILTLYISVCINVHMYVCVGYKTFVSVFSKNLESKNT